MPAGGDKNESHDNQLCDSLPFALARQLLPWFSVHD
jgi:hypothetical protein